MSTRACQSSRLPLPAIYFPCPPPPWAPWSQGRQGKGLGPAQPFSCCMGSSTFLALSVPVEMQEER